MINLNKEWTLVYFCDYISEEKTYSHSYVQDYFLPNMTIIFFLICILFVEPFDVSTIALLCCVKNIPLSIVLNLMKMAFSSLHHIHIYIVI